MSDPVLSKSKSVEISKPLDIDDTMLGCFIGMIEIRVKRIAPIVSSDPNRKPLLDEIQEELNSFAERFGAARTPENHQAWAAAYRIERLVALIEPKENLVAELKRRLAEAADEHIPSVPRLTASVDSVIPLVIDTSKQPPVLRDGGEDILRSLLLDTLEEMHWCAQRKFYSRPLQKNAAYRIVLAGAIAFVIFLLPYIFIYADFFKGQDPSLSKWPGLPLYTALTAGLFGAFFSRLLYIQQNRDALTLGAIRDARDINSILLRGCVGMTGAVVVYFFLQSGALGGSLFPKFDEIAFDQPIFPKDHKDNISVMHLFYPNSSLALLVVWCFIAGFSERFVPSILQSTEASLGKSEKK